LTLPGKRPGQPRRDGNSGQVLVNRAKRAVIKPRELGACIVTGTEKIRSGFGNGDCLMLDFRNLVFAVSDATERYPAASFSLLSRFAERLARDGTPDNETAWRKLLNDVYEGQKFHHKATLSCVAVRKEAGTTTACVCNGGDSITLLINLTTRSAEYATTADMCFAGRTRELLCVDEIPLENDGYGFIIASDGITDTARLSGRTLERVSGSVLSRVPLHEIPEGLAEYLEGLPGPAEYDDIGLIAFSPTALEAADYPTILVGGTTPVEEVTHLESVSDKVIDDTWTTLDDMKGSMVRI
jgi:hypothetical protein